MPETEKEPLQINVVSDVMCPWCYIGKRNLEAALETVADVDTEIVWRPYQLDPTLPKSGKDRAEYLNTKFGGEERAREIYSRVNDAGTQVGIPFAFKDIKVSPNTLDAHRLILWAGGQSAELQDAVVERLFKAYFLEGKHIGDDTVLREIAEDAGMDGKLVEQLLQGDSDAERIKQEISQAQQMGITGVPCFIIDNKYAVMGAQPAEALAQAIRQAAGDRQEEAGYKSEA